jgi:hypothetical protein
MLIGVKYSCTVGEVESQHKEEVSSSHTNLCMNEHVCLCVLSVYFAVNWQAISLCSQWALSGLYEVRLKLLLH